MNFMRQIALGKRLTKLTNLVEQVVLRDSSLPIGCCGADGLSDEGRSAISEELESMAPAFAKLPRHKVTLALAQNMRLSMKMGRQDRAMAQSRLLEMLVAKGSALSMDDFVKSYL